MPHQTLLLISSPDLGWTDLERAARARLDTEVVGITARAARARDLARAHEPDAIICAAAVEGRCALPLLAELRQLCPRSRIVVVAARPDPTHLPLLAARGVDGYVIWEDLSRETLAGRLDTLLAPGWLVSSPATTPVVRAALLHEPNPHADVERFTDAERAVLRRLAEGLHQNEIPTVEPLSERSVQRIVAKLMAKLDAPNSFVLAMRATQRGLIQ
jgi:DNA-binding NarL/FixJ family response regulator